MLISHNALEFAEWIWQTQSGEKISVEQEGNVLYGYGTELAVLRIFLYYNQVEGEKVRGQITQTSKGIAFRLEIFPEESFS